MVIAIENRAGHSDYPWPVVGAVEDREKSEYKAAYAPAPVECEYIVPRGIQ
jgi:hypothetical protein